MSRRPLRPIEVHLYRICDELTGVLLALMALFSPWAFGTTQPWSKWTMNIGGYLLGALLAGKIYVRGVRGYRPGTWRFQGTSTVLARVLLVLTAAILLYCLISALNARASYNRAAFAFEYHDCVAWLPHSLEGASTWFAFWCFLALALSFWAAWDWLSGKSRSEELGRSRGESEVVPARFRFLLWLLSMNGLLLAIEAIAQRLEGSGKLLFLVQPRVNPGAVTQFGPWAYRANAAAYFNLLWPVCLGFWWTLNRAPGAGRKHHVLLLCAAAMAACPIISTSRGGAIVSVIMLAVGLLLLPLTHFLVASRHEKPGRRRRNACLVALFIMTALGLGWSLGWDALKPRIGELRENFRAREQMYDRAEPMARDYPVFGTGPGTFNRVFEHYRISTDTYWPAQLHNDWLETRITFGWIGSALAGLAFATVLARYFVRGGIYPGRKFVLLTWVALAGCLLHARFDFPFQIYSILFLFLLICALLFTVSRHPT